MFLSPSPDGLLLVGSRTDDETENGLLSSTDCFDASAVHRCDTQRFSRCLAYNNLYKKNNAPFESRKVYKKRRKPAQKLTYSWQPISPDSYQFTTSACPLYTWHTPDPPSLAEPRLYLSTHVLATPTNMTSTHCSTHWEGLIRMDLYRYDIVVTTELVPGAARTT